MKNYRAILIISLVLITITIFFNFKSISSLKEQNNALVANINRITERIAALESDNTMEQLITLKEKNMALQKEIEDLKAELSRIPKNIAQPSSQQIRQDIKKQAAKERSVVGNKGFLLKNSKPTH